MPYTKIIESGDILEVYEFEKEPPEGRRISKKRHSRNVIRSPERRADNLNRLQRRFRRIIRSSLSKLGPPALVSLTMLSNHGVKQAWSEFTTFIKIFRDKYKIIIRYASVLEFQKNNTPHFHVLIWGLPQNVIHTERNTRLLQNIWQNGYVDCTTTDGHPKLAGYLSKYLSKSMSDNRLLGQKAYSTSRNIVRPMLYAIKEEFTSVSEYFLNHVDNSTLLIKDFDTKWMGKGRYRLYKIKKNDGLVSP